MWYRNTKLSQYFGSDTGDLSGRSQGWFLRAPSSNSFTDQDIESEDENIPQESKEQVPSEPLSDDWLKNAKSWIGTPYVFGGNSKSGIDCSSFIQKVFPEKNLPRVARDQQKVGVDVDPEDVSQWTPGDRIYFDMNARLGSGNNVADHTGIYIGNNEFIQASSSKGVTISNISPGSFYHKKTIAVKR